VLKASATVHNLGEFGPFWARKVGEIAPKMASRTLFWVSKWTQNGPKMTPKQPQQYSIVVVSTTVYYLGAFRSFWGEERGETRSKLLILITDIAWFFNFEQP